MKKIILPVLCLSIAFATISCSGEDSSKETSTDSKNDSSNIENEPEEKAPAFEDICVLGNDIFTQVKGYEYGMSETFTTNGKFDVVRSEWIMLNDSTAELKLYNYELGNEAPENFQIYMKLNAKNGEILKPETYAYNDYDKSFWTKVTLNTNAGIVWFNWSMGMPPQGVVKIDFVDKDHVCGKFMLEVNDASTSIGHVVLNGSFAHSN